MKKFISVVLASMLSITSFGITAFAQETDRKAEVLQVTETGSALPNTYAKMRKGEDIHLGYFGGSVTNGYGPANAYNEATQGGVNCWRGLSKTWLQEVYGTKYGVTFHEESRITSVTHAGAGGTGVDLNLYRADLYLDLQTTDPVDLLFIEFAVNDGYEGNSYEKSAFYMESLICKVREISPTTDIVVLLTTNHTHMSNNPLVPHMNAQAHIDVAKHYGVPYFWFGEYIYDFLAGLNGGTLPASGSELWLTYFSDGVHPSVRGYAKYFEFLRDNLLKPNLDENTAFSDEIVNYTVPETPYNKTQEFLTNNAAYHPGSASVYYNQKLRTDAYLMFPSQITNMGTSGYGYLTYKPGGWGAFTSSDPGMSFTLKLKSRGAGIFYKGHPTQGLLEYRVDGGKWQQKDMYSAASDQYEYFMLYENLEETEHTVDIILRKTKSGSAFEFKSLFIDGDSTLYGAVVLEGAPNSEPLNETIITPTILTTTYLQTRINDGATASLYRRHAVTDTDVVRYTPNTSSSNAIMFDHYSDLFKSISVPEYKYAVIKYYYELEPGSTTANAVGKRAGMDFINLANGTPNRASLESADPIVLGGTSAHTAIVDLTAITSRTGHTGNLTQMQFHPYGFWTLGKSLSATELMNIESISFYANYPYEDEYEIDVAVDKTVSSTKQTIDLTGKRILPSAHRYATVKYTASADTNLTLTFDGLYNVANPSGTKSFTVTKKAPKDSGEIIVDLAELAESGHIFYYENFKLSADNSIDVDEVTFTVDYPDPDAEFTVSFDANGGTGNTPVAISGKVDKTITLPTASLQKGTQIFLGWSESANSEKVITEIKIRPENVTLYAVYKDINTLYVTNNAEGKFTFNGVEVTADYTTLAEAVAALGADGGRIVLSGVQNGNGFFTSQNASAPMITLEGADSNAAILLTDSTVTLRCNTTFKNINIARGTYYKSSENRIAITDVYINANGKRLVLDTGAIFRNERSSGDINNPSSGQFDTNTEVQIPGYLSGGQLIMNSGKISGNFSGASYNRDSAGNIYMEFNGGTPGNEISAGALRFSDGSHTHTGNITVVLNGGTFNSNSIIIDRSTTKTTAVTGAASVIINNGLSDEHTFTIDPKFEYVIKSAVGGKATLAAEGSDTKAPTFLLKATDPEKVVYINGAAVNCVNGEYVFTPGQAGTFTVTYEDAPAPSLDDILDMNNDGLFNSLDIINVFSNVIAKINSGNTDVSGDVPQDTNDDSKLNFRDIWNLMRILREYYEASLQQ